MPNTVCPHCGASGRVPDTFLGRRVRCPKCQQPFTVTAPPSPPAPAPSSVRPKTPPPAAAGGTTIPATPRLIQRPTPPAPPPAQEDSLEEVGEEVDVEVVAEAPAAAPVGPGGRIRYLRAYQYITENPKWITNVLLMGVCGLIPAVGGIVVSGYGFDVVENLATRGGPGYPDFDFARFGKYLMRGLWPFLITLIVYLPLVIVVQVLSVAMGFVLPDVVARLFTLVGFLLLFFLVPLALMPLWIYTGLSQRFDLGGSFKFAQDFFKRVGTEILLAQLVLSFTSLLVGCVLCCLFFVSMPVVTLAYDNLYAQLYQLYLQRGGEPIPLKQEVEEQPEVA